MDKLISLTKNHLASLRRKVSDLMIVPFLFVLVISWKAPMTSGKHTHTKYKCWYIYMHNNRESTKILTYEQIIPVVSSQNLSKVFKSERG